MEKFTLNDLVKRSEVAEAMCLAICGKESKLCVSLPEDCDQNCMKPLFLTPTIEAMPVVHGRWEKHKPDALLYWMCSACKNCAFLEEPNAKFCPHCGAKMDAETIKSNK